MGRLSIAGLIGSADGAVPAGAGWVTSASSLEWSSSTRGATDSSRAGASQCPTGRISRIPKEMASTRWRTTAEARCNICTTIRALTIATVAFATSSANAGPQSPTSLLKRSLTLLRLTDALDFRFQRVKILVTPGTFAQKSGHHRRERATEERVKELLCRGSAGDIRRSISQSRGDKLELHVRTSRKSSNF
jgi:hypothetical protein